MFNTIKDFINNWGGKQGLTYSTISDVCHNVKFANYNRSNSQQILKKLNGYQYISGDIVAKTVAAQKLRLYANESNKRSKYHKGREQLIVKNIPVSKHRLSYLKGEQELSHNYVSNKALRAERDIVEILDHPALDLIKNVNPYSNQWEFFYTLTMAMQFYGNSFFHKVRYTDGSVAEIWYVPPQYMDIIQLS